MAYFNIKGTGIDDLAITPAKTWSSFKINGLLLGLGDKDVRSTRFEAISSGTTGSVTLSPDQTVILDDFGGTIDAIITTIAGGRPTTSPAQDISGTIIATTFNAGGGYTLTGTPSSYPVAIMYRVRQKLSTYLDTDTNVVGYPTINEVQSVNGKTGTVVLDAIDVGALDAVNALTDELVWNQLYPSFYTEAQYNIGNQVIQRDTWNNPAKTIHLFTETFTYTLNNVTNTTVTNILSGSTLSKNITYDINGKYLTSTRTYTP